MPLFRKRATRADNGRDDEPADPEERSPGHGVKFKDLAVMGQLLKAGADLSVPRQVVYYSYAPSARVAETMAAAASAQGFTSAVREPLPEYPGRWSVICEATAVVDPSFVRTSTDFFEELADLHEAEYDGWEAAV